MIIRTSPTRTNITEKNSKALWQKAKCLALGVCLGHHAIVAH